MEFTSLHFLGLFLVLVIVVKSGVLNHTWQKAVLLLASYYFYACWDWRFTALLAFATLVTYTAGIRIEQGRTVAARKFAISGLVIALLGILFYFKYANFFIQNFQLLLGKLGWTMDIALLQLVLPIGISFFTFQCISYGIDVYRGQTSACRSPLDFALYIAFFPTLLSGPITRSHQILPQFALDKPPHDDQDAQGLALMVRGFAKKLIFADVLGAQLVGPAFDNPAAFSPMFLIVAVYAYSYQIYMDLSGYTDIARGAAATLGYRLPVNFNRPYLATSVSNFWQRWHMSMSGFFRDYLFFGLGGSKYGNVYLNLFITFICIGFWHGASWGFILYGAIHGMCVAWERWQRNKAERAGLKPKEHSGARLWLRIFLVFSLIAFSRVLFRAADIDAAFAYFAAILEGGGQASPWRAPALVLLAMAVILHYLPGNLSEKAVRRFVPLPVPLQAAGLLAATYLLSTFVGSGAPFLYFQF